MTNLLSGEPAWGEGALESGSVADTRKRMKTTTETASQIRFMDDTILEFVFQDLRVDGLSLSFIQNAFRPPRLFFCVVEAGR